MTKKILLILIILLTWLSASAKVKVREICSVLKFEGEELVKNKETKQKEPLGEGTLFLSWDKKPSLNDYNFVSISGTFQGNCIYNACVKFGSRKIFQGNAEYTFDFYKKRECLNVTLNFKDGVMFFGWDEQLPFKITEKNNMGYTIVFSLDRFCSDRIIKPTRTEFSFQSSGFPKGLDLLSDKIRESIYNAKWDEYNDSWKTKWLQTSLDNGMTISGFEDSAGRLSIYNFEGDNMYLSSDSLRLPLKDGGLFEWNEKKRIIKLTYPTGEIYEGTFSKVPFEYTRKESYYSEESNAFAYNHYPYGSKLSTYLTIVNSSTSEFVPHIGKSVHPDGTVKYLVEGIDIAPRIRNTNNGKLLSDRHEIVAKCIINYRKSHYDDYSLIEKLSRGVLIYAGKDKCDELDRDLYLRSDQYKTDKQAYDSLRSNQLFCFAKDIKETSFSTRGITIRTLDYSDRFKDLDLGNWVKIPCKGNFKEGSDWEIPIDNLELLKLLKDYQKSLALLATYKAGEWSDYRGKVIAHPVGLYIYESKSGAVLYDLSYMLTTTTSAELQKRTAEAKRQEAAEDKRREAEQAKRYHKKAKREICTICHGRGYSYDNNGKERFCTWCMGKGYYETHYYDD